MTVSELKSFEDKRCKLICGDGEVIRAKVLFVDPECEDVIIDVESTTHPEKWPGGHTDPESAYTLTVEEIESVIPLSD